MMDRPLFLIGYRGVGKTTVGRLLALSLNLPFVDADILLQSRAGCDIRTLFQTEGEAKFRDRESAIIAELASGPPQVVATGGGVILREDNRRELTKGWTVWLTASAEVLHRRIEADALSGGQRPNLAQGGFDEVRTMLELREPLYRVCANFVVDVEALSPAEIRDRIIAACQPSLFSPT